MARVSVVIPNFNGAAVLPDCFQALDRQTFTDFELVLVDNGSTDDSVSLTSANRPDARVLTNQENLGFAAAVNRGVAETVGPYVALLNNDVQVEPEWLEHLFAALDARPDVFAVGPKLLLDPQRDRINVVGIKLKRYLESASIGAGQRDEGRFDRPGEVFGVSAGAALYRRAAFDDVGLFDEDFFAYLEDVDLSFRGRLLGWRFWYEPRARGYHLKGWTTRSRMSSRFEVYHASRNHLYYQVKNVPAGVWRAKRRAVVARHLELMFRHSVQHLHKGEAGPWWSGKLDYWRNRDRITAKRETIQRRRRITDQQLLSWLGREVVESAEVES